MCILDERLDRMIEIASICGVTLDHVVATIGRLDQRDFDAVALRPSLLPLYTKSRVKP